MKYGIKVVNKSTGEISHTHRILRHEPLGNFDFITCTYQGKKRVVKSIEGDLSDPFRRDETYLNSLYIEI